MRLPIRLAAILLSLLPALAFCVQGQAGPYRVEIVSDPAVLPVGKATLDVAVSDGSGKPVDGVTVKAIAQMPNMAMGEREQMAAPTGVPGHYRFTQSFSMAGGYDARISVAGPLGSGTATIPLETGKTTVAKASGGSPVLALWPWALGLCVAVFVLMRMRKTGQQLDARRALNPQAVGAIAVLGIVVAVAVYAVNHFRRSGSMTPIEAQTMTMDMPPPEGVLPVTLATVEKRPLGATVRYSGQAMGFVEQDVNARTGGVIVWMPAYVGTAVKKGEVIARLDTSQLAPQVAQSQAMVESARQGVGVAEAEYRQAQAMVDQAEAERGQYEGAVEEAKANLSAARDDRESALAGVASAQADERDAQARAASAAADQKYWAEEMKRESALLAAGAISKDEYERERADASKSEAAARQAGEQVRSAHAKVQGAEASVRRSASTVVAAQRKVDQAQAALLAHHAHVATARAEASAARQKISQSASGVSQAQAALQGVAAQAGYAEIRSEIDGIVTQRAISPGTLVSPGQTVLRVAQVRPIRLQANVPTADLARIHVGTPVSVKRADGTGAVLSAAVTSVSPSLDPVSRTGTVEVVLANRDKGFLPGQFVSLEFSVGSEGSQFVVPSAAIQSSVADGNTVQAGATSAFVWVASPVSGQPNRFTVSRSTVELGESSGEFTSIRSGLEAGTRVVVTGASGLSEGDTVSAPSPAPPKDADPTVSITEEGFVPATLTLPTGSRRFIFVRKTDNTCAKQVVFPTLKITSDLPLNKQVTIELPASTTGTLNYACGMNMLKGSVIVK